MKKNICKRFLITLSAVLFVFSFNLPANAVADKNNEYIEYTNQIYFDNIDIAVADDDEIILIVEPNANLFDKLKAKSDIKKFDVFIDKYPETKNAIIDNLSSSELCAVGYTETPLIMVDNHYERTTSESKLSETGETEKRGYFSMTTSIMRTGNPTSAGEYLYSALTLGEWSKNSIWGGSNYPASGDDYVIQTLTSNAVLDEHNMMVLYNDDEYGEEGIHSYPESGGVNYIKYAVKYDPFGTKQIKAFLLISKFYAPATNFSRAIHSGYTHTWKKLDIDVSVSKNIDNSFVAGAGITINPSIVEKSWNLFSIVSFRF